MSFYFVKYLIQQIDLRTQSYYHHFLLFFTPLYSQQITVYSTPERLHVLIGTHLTRVSTRGVCSFQKPNNTSEEELYTMYSCVFTHSTIAKKIVNASSTVEEDTVTVFAPFIGKATCSASGPTMDVLS